MFWNSSSILGLITIHRYMHDIEVKNVLKVVGPARQIAKERLTHGRTPRQTFHDSFCFLFWEHGPFTARPVAATSLQFRFWSPCATAAETRPEPMHREPSRAREGAQAFRFVSFRSHSSPLPFVTPSSRFSSQGTTSISFTSST